MWHNFLRTIFILLPLFFWGCTQDPARIVINPTTSKGNSGISLSNPYKIVVQKGDTLYIIAQKNNVEIRDIIETNRLRPPYTLIIGQSLKLPQPIFHIVSQSDNLYAISRSYGVDISRLAKKNGLSPPYNLTAGQKLLLPSQAENTDISVNLLTKSGKYSSDTKDSLASSSKVFTNEIASLDRKPLINSSNEDGSPFAIQQKNPKPSSAKGKGSIAIHKEDNDNHAPFQYKSEQRFAESAANLEEPPIDTSGTFSEDLETKPASKNVVLGAAHVSHEIKKQTASKVAKIDSDFLEEDDSSTPQVTKTSGATKPGFYWPVKGNIISKFGPKKGGLYNDGVNIAAKEGTPIMAADDGEVVYAGNELRGYGNMLLVKHNNGYLTSYAHTDDFLVKKGDIIKKGQRIAHVGQTGHVNSPQLHFSVRQGRKAIDPEKYISAG